MKINPVSLLLILLTVVLTASVAFINYLVFSSIYGNSPKMETADEPEKDQDLYSENLDGILDRTKGNIPILEYHIIETPLVETNLFLSGKLTKTRNVERFVVTSEELRYQLETLYTNGFRNISLNEYLSLMKGLKKGLQRLHPGNKLYVITFDDATYGQFDYIGNSEEGSSNNPGSFPDKPEIDPNCAVGIMMNLARKHPDFKLNAAFCVDFENPPFHQEKFVGQKLNALLDMGFEIVNHTRSHRKLTGYLPGNPDKAAYEIGSAMELFESYLGGKISRVNKVCYPDGNSNPSIWKFIRKFEYHGREYHFAAGLDAKGYQARNPNESAFNPYNISRIETSKYSFESYVLNAKNVFTIPTLAEVISNKTLYRQILEPAISYEPIRLD